MAQIKIENLTFTYAASQLPAINNISLEIKQGDFVVVCGASGCGKSTLLRNLKPAIRPAGKIQGKVSYNGQCIDAISDREQAKSFGFVLQSPEHQIVTDKVWHELAFGLENLGYKTEDIRLRVAEMAEYFGITDLYYRSVDKLSGGQKQLLNLAAVMTMHPEVLILDEPTAQLDPIAAEGFIDILKKVNRDLGITVILSEHRLNYVMEDADQLLVMNKGEVLVFDKPQVALSKVVEKDLLKLMPVQVQLFKEYVASNENVSEIPMSIAEGRKWINSLSISGEIEADRTIGEEVVICKNLWFRYDRNGEDIIKGLNMQVYKGEIFVILGGNGTGKTTAMSLLSGVNKAYRGKLKINGRVSALPQNVQTLFRKESVAEELKGVSENIIEQMELGGLMDSHPYDISGGQQQKLALAKVLEKDPDILILDEPTKAIDGIYKENLGEILLNMKKQGKTIIIVSHDVDFCGQFADRCGLFAQGSLIAVNNFREFFANNRFYTTTVSKMAGHVIKKAVKKEDVLCFPDR